MGTCIKLKRPPFGRGFITCIKLYVFTLGRRCTRWGSLYHLSGLSAMMGQVTNIFPWNTRELQHFYTEPSTKIHWKNPQCGSIRTVYTNCIPVLSATFLMLIKVPDNLSHFSRHDLAYFEARS